MGTATYDPPTPFPLSGLASLFVTYRYHRDKSGSDRFEVLPNVRCEEIHWQEGGVVQSASFSYVLDDSDPGTPWPFLIEEFWPLTATGPYVVLQDDELIVREYDELNLPSIVFDGFAVVPQAEQGQGLTGTFTAAGVGIRLNDDPVGGAVMRAANKPNDGDPVPTDLPCWFNPNGKANKTPDGHDYHDGAADQHPLFLDWRLPGVPAFWKLADFVRYVFWTTNPDEKWVKNPVALTGKPLDEYLQSVAPTDGTGYMNLSDPATYTRKPIYVRSFDASGKSPVDAAVEQLSYYGFHLAFDTRENPDDPEAPLNELVVYRTDGLDEDAPVELFYPTDRSHIADDLPDFTGLAVGRDAFNLANEVHVESALKEYEVGVVLAPLFSVSAADALAPKQFDTAALADASAETRKRYRLFGADECGLGHWSFGSSSFVTDAPLDLDAVFGAPVEGQPLYAKRFRPGKNQLLSKDATGKARPAALFLSRDYAGAAPALWDGSGTWRFLGDSGWRLDDDQLAVWLSVDKPESWRLPKSDDNIVPGDVVRVVSSLAAPTTRSPRFFLLLVTAVEADDAIHSRADRRDASPSRFTVRRRIDARDHFKMQTVSKSSHYNRTGADVVSRDDTPKADAAADALREAKECPVVGGSFRVPWITHSFRIGDRVSKVSGRDMDLTASAGAAAGETPRYPFIVGFTWTCQNPQATVFKLTDRRSEPEDVNHGYGHSR